MIQIDSIRLIFVFIVAFLLAFSATPIVSVLAHKIGAVDIPKDARRVHKNPIPRLGGLAIFYGFIIAVFCFIDISYQLRGVLLGAVIIVTLGVLDDCLELPAWLKLLIQIGAALLVIYHGVEINTFTNPFGGDPIPIGIWTIPITILWIVGVTNAVNLLDGLDGLAVGISSITSIVMVIISMLMGQAQIALIAVALAGAGFGFMPFNFHPAKIFMGDTGSTFLGFMLASISIMGLFKIYAMVSFVVPFLILLLPLLDTLIAIIRRLLSGQSPMKPDRGHFHHKLLDSGMTQKQAVITLYTLSGLLSLSAIVMILTGILHGLLLIIAAAILAFFGYKFIFKDNIDIFHLDFKNKDEQTEEEK